MLRSLLIALLLGMFAGVGTAQADSAPQIPANVQAILKKIGEGVAPTAAEKKTLSDWQSGLAKSMGGGAAGKVAGAAPGGRPAPSKVAGYFSVGVTSAANNPCHAAGKAVGFGTTPSRDAYVAMAKDAMRTYRAHLTAAAQSSLNSVLGQVPVAGYGAAIAPIMVLHGNGSAAVVAAAYSAQKDAKDATTANNLGAILRGMHDYARAAIALQYAASLAPKSAMIASNLGWLAFGQGDQKTATKFFSAAAQGNSKFGPAQLGQGFVALCSGKPAQALTPLRAAVADGDYSDVVADAVYSADEDLVDTNDPSADTASPSVYGSGSQGGGGGNPPDWQDPPFPQDAGAFAAMYTAKPDPVLDYIETYLQKRKMAAVNIIAASRSGAQPSTSSSGQQIVFQRGSGKQAFEISDITGMISRQTKPLLDQWDQYVRDSMQRDGCRGCFGGTQPNPMCSGQAQFKSIHSSVYGRERQDWNELRKDIDDLYGFAGPVISQINDPSLAKSEAASLEVWSDDEISFFVSSMKQWEHEANNAYEPHDCNKPTPPKAVGSGVLKPYPVDPTKCRTGAISMNMGFANLNADCDKLTLTIGQGLAAAALNWKFAPDYTQMADGSLRPTGTDWSQDQITIFLGAGASTENIPVSVSGGVGGYITIQGGSVTDIGGQATIGGTIGTAGDYGAGTMGYESPTQAGETMTGTVGIASGPDVSMSGAIRTGGVCGYSC